VVIEMATCTQINVELRTQPCGAHKEVVCIPGCIIGQKFSNTFCSAIQNVTVKCDVYYVELIYSFIDRNS